VNPTELHGRRIMIVEDESLIAMLIEDQLDELGCVVAAQAASVAEACTELAGCAVDAAMLDVNLRGEASYAVAEALAARGVPYLFTTGYGQAGLDPAYRDKPVLQKPFSTEALAAALSQLLHPTGASSRPTGSLHAEDRSFLP